MKKVYLLLIFVIVLFICIAIYKKFNKHKYLDNLDGPSINTNIYIEKSPIHGVGLFINKDYKPNDFLYKAITPTKEITYHGSLINHSYKPNTYLLENKNGWFIMALKDIKKGSELTVNYTHTPSFIKKPDPSWK